MPASCPSGLSGCCKHHLGRRAPPASSSPFAFPLPRVLFQPRALPATGGWGGSSFPGRGSPAALFHPWRCGWWFMTRSDEAPGPGCSDGRDVARGPGFTAGATARPDACQPARGDAVMPPSARAQHGEGRRAWRWASPPPGTQCALCRPVSTKRPGTAGPSPPSASLEDIGSGWHTLSDSCPEAI